MVEGGGRKGLPQSFLSRFSRVFVEAMSEEDMLDIVAQAFSSGSSPSSSPSALTAGTAAGVGEALSGRDGDVEMTRDPLRGGYNKEEEENEENEATVERLEASEPLLVQSPLRPHLAQMVRFVRQLQQVPIINQQCDASK